MDVPVIQIFQGLQSFNPSSENRGRMNIYKVKDGYVILDYGHNQDAIISMGKMLAHFPGYTKSSVFGLPGDRSQDLILKTVTSAANVFDKFILRDDDDLRGRKAGEMPALMCEAIRKLKPECECTTILSESSAVDFALENIRPKEIVTIFYDDFENVWKSLSKWDPIPVNEMPLQKAKIKLNESAMRVREPAEAKDAISV
jgi:cyanophycin synthetase